MRTDRLQVALIMVAVGDLTGSGGAERQFADLFAYLRACDRRSVRLITSRTALARLQAAGHLHHTDGVVALPLGAQPGRSPLNVIWLTVLLLLETVGRGLDVVHVCLPTPTYVPFASVLGMLPRSWRPRIVISVIDCTVAHNLTAAHVSDLYERQVLDAHQLYARWTVPDGVFTWYRAFVEAVKRTTMFSSRTLLGAAKYCFTDPERFQPAASKDRLIVYAGRLSAQKRPLLFVDAIASLVAADAALIAGWRVEMYGRGVLEDEVRARIRTHKLDHVIVLTSTPDMSAIFARSRLFVSTQLFENFTSLAMLEAMAAGNAVVAEDVGQTREFVRDNVNGLLVPAATPTAFAGAIGTYLRHPQHHDRMAAESRRLATEVHTIQHFASDIEAFWSQAATT